MADPRGSIPSGYRQDSDGGGGTAHTSLPTDEPLVYYQTAPSQYAAGSPNANNPMYSAPQTVRPSYPSISALNQQPMHPPGYPQAFGASPMYPSGAQPHDPVYNASASQMPSYAHFRSLPPGPGVAGFSQTTGNAYNAAAPQNLGPAPWGAVQPLPMGPYYPSAHQAANSGWHAAVSQNTTFGYGATAQYLTETPYMPSPHVQNTGNYASAALTVNPSGRSGPSPQHPPIGTFILYSPRRLAFSETSGRSRGAVRYKRPCLIHDIVKDSSRHRALWIVPLTGTHKGKRKPGMNANWWQPVQWHTRTIDAPRVPEDNCSVPTSSGYSSRKIDRQPISLSYTLPPPECTTTRLGDKIPQLKPDYIWVGDIGEAIRLMDTNTMEVIMNSILSPYYAIREQTITELHSEMMFWKLYSAPRQDPEDDIPGNWGIGYPPAPQRW